MPKDGNLGAAVTAAMETVEDHFPPLSGQLPKDYECFEDDVLEEMMRTFDSEALRTRLVKILERPAGQKIAPFQRLLESAIAVGYVGRVLAQDGADELCRALGSTMTIRSSPSMRRL